MRICNHCGKLTAGRPLFCNHCGRSFSVKLCPRLHLNSRDAEACSQCGSRELSAPHDRLPFRFRVLMFLLGAIPGFALIALSIFYVRYFFLQLIHDPYTLLVPMLYGLALAVTWFIWLHLPLLLLGLRSWRRTRK